MTADYPKIISSPAAGQEGGSAGFSRGIRHWNGFRSAGIPINAGEQVSVALGRRQRTNDIDMNVVKAGVRRRKGLQGGFDILVDLRLLTVMTRSGPGGNRDLKI